MGHSVPAGIQSRHAFFQPQAAGPRAGTGRVRPTQITTLLGDDRFQELIRGASAFFAAAERDEVAEKAQAIREIQRLMAEYGLTVDDLAD